jgi:hypothetical protein
MGKPQAGHSFWIGHNTVSWSARSRGEVLAICTSCLPGDSRIHHRFQTAKFAGLEKKAAPGDADGSRGRAAEARWKRKSRRSWG